MPMELERLKSNDGFELNESLSRRPSYGGRYSACAAWDSLGLNSNDF